jgi:hypothetical protein
LQSPAAAAGAIAVAQVDAVYAGHTLRPPAAPCLRRIPSRLWSYCQRNPGLWPSRSLSSKPVS